MRNVRHSTVKQELKDFEARVKYIKFLQDKKVSVPAPNMHMMFTGNPGTGKTTVARKIADCLYQIGVLKTNKLIVAERKDLVGTYVGGTAPKTSELIKKAYNGVLFIDEVYSLYRLDDPKDTGTEAIATLIAAMENDKDKLVVIFAGYREEMRVFQSANPGIASRIGFTFHFPDYTPDELTEMFYKKMRKNGFVINSASLEQVKKLMVYFSEMKDFGNGRFVDKVIDMTINNRAKRSFSRKYNDITQEDIPEIKDLISISANSQFLRTDEEQSEAMRRRLASLFGGRNAERLILGDHSSGCAGDVAQAKRIAVHMIDDLAMGELGITTAMDLLQEADQKAADILLQNKSVLLRIADQLFEKGTIVGSELQEELCR